ncbi:hypothetical protein ACFX13_006894 [Malus domestica]
MLLRARSILVPFTISTLTGQEHLGAVCNLSSCRQGAFVAAFYARVNREHLVPFAISARAGKELLLSSFMLVRTGSFGCRLLGSCEREALV